MYNHVFVDFDSAVASLVTCSNDHAVACFPLLEYVAHSLKEPRFYQMYSYCDVIDINYDTDVSACVDAQGIEFDRFKARLCYSMQASDVTSVPQLCR